MCIRDSSSSAHQSCEGRGHIPAARTNSVRGGGLVLIRASCIEGAAFYVDDVAKRLGNLVARGGVGFLHLQKLRATAQLKDVEGGLEDAEGGFRLRASAMRIR
eukprot:3535757-Pyramimonas_sp.AAC.1